ncbi:NepR family anti-sigma factor [Falsiroseomonas sp. CW058]|uniref:NepR family anti-sigma factor n=1 Tax=Falsiroseomonas sp. CW058 TaxID=3388664 RepID=UPI003D30F1A9
MSANLQTMGAPAQGAAPLPPGLPRDPGEAAFDRWLQRELSRLYDAALSEPVPDDLLRLLKETERK